ncbi:Ribose operon repressor [compost metagenome]
MGFDGIEFGQMTSPPLTTIKQPDSEMGRLACKILLDMLHDNRNPNLDLMLQPKLLERGTVATKG